MFDKYLVGKDGSVVSKYNDKTLSVHVDKKGYHRVNIHSDNGRKTYLVHRVVALVHIPNPHDLPQVNHLDGDKSNNCVDNLEWCTGRQNVKHSVESGFVKRGSNRPNAKLTDEQVLRMRDLRDGGGYTYYELGRLFNISYQSAQRVCAKLTYSLI